MPIIFGGQPPSPRDLSHYEPKHEKGQWYFTLPHASVTRLGAQVASQHCLILQVSRVIIA
ncbi:MAG: hypothetical protein GY795_26250 [Desulfobacterales bacterium]|nr:hypothetical protein [Desulfobacterales bacterium]